MHRQRFAFTIIEMLVVMGVIALLIGILLPAIGRARDTARQRTSESNLRQLGQAHANYASEWNGRQFTLAIDNIASYGLDEGVAVNNANTAAQRYLASMVDRFGLLPSAEMRRRYYPPGIALGHNTLPPGEGLRSIDFHELGDSALNRPLMAPLVFDASLDVQDFTGFGWFRLPNALAFSTYLSSRFYDPVFYAPKDDRVLDYIEPGLDSPSGYVPLEVLSDGYENATIGYSSYSLSPAALFAPSVMRDPSEGGWQNPWSLAAGMRAPSLSDARYASLKTHMIEHHWLQNRRASCNPSFVGGYGNCTPYYFNASIESAPSALFYDASVRQISVRAAMRADERVHAQSGARLWSRDTALGANGYFIDRGYDNAETSFHILTTRGILGRDLTEAE